MYWKPDPIETAVMLFLTAFVMLLIGGIIIHSIFFYDAEAEKQDCPVVEIDGRRYVCD